LFLFFVVGVLDYERERERDDNDKPKQTPKDQRTNGPKVVDKFD